MGKKKFKRQGSSQHKRVPDKWRRPRGGDSKKRKEKKSKGALVKVGHRKPKSERGIHPSGYKEVLVHNAKEVEDVDSENQAIRIGSSVGKRKRKSIVKAADKKNIKILNANRRDLIGSEDAEEISG